MSWEDDYTRMREVARLAGWDTPEQLNPPTEGLKVATATDKFGAYWSLILQPLMLERLDGLHITHIYPDGNVQHREFVEAREPDPIIGKRDIYSFGPLCDPPWNVDRAFLAEDQRDA